MTMLGIISQIDAYLSRLHLARDILAKSLPDPPAKRKEKTSPSKKAGPVVSTKAQHPASSRSKFRRSPRTDARKRVVSVPHISSSPTHQVKDGASLAELVSITVPENHVLPVVNTELLPSLPNINIVRLPYKGPRGSIRTSHTRGLKVSEPTHGTGAVVGSVNSRIVVVSPVQAKKEHERIAQPEIQPRAVFKSGLTGRVAFESLFKDTSDRSN
jgi:hypothetical protein